MKTKYNIQKCLGLLLFLGFLACTNEDIVDGGNNSPVEAGILTTLSLDLSVPVSPQVEMMTKTADANGKFGEISTLAVLVFDGSKEQSRPTVTYVPDFKNWDKKFNITTGVNRRVYVLANPKQTSEAAIQAEYPTYADFKGKLENLIEATTTPTGGEMMVGYVRTDVSYFDINDFIDQESESLKIEPTTSGVLYARLYPPYSKITFTIKNEVTDMQKQVLLDIESVSIRNLPTKYSLIPKEESIGLGDVESDEYLLSLDEKNQVLFYMYENRQGIHNANNQNAYSKNPFDGKNIENITGDWDAKWAGNTPCTYIEVKGSYKIWQGSKEEGWDVGSGPISYRFFLGEDAIKDFNIKRNISYNITLAFTGVAGYGELDYEWRVNADLKHTTFVPEGRLDIDGSYGYYFPFYVINHSGKEITFTTTNKSTSDMKIEYKDRYNTLQQVTTPGEDMGVKNGEYMEYGIGSNNIGVLGSAGHYEGAGKDDDNSYGYFGSGSIEVNGKSVKSGMLPISQDDYKPNIDLRPQIINGEIYRERTFTLTLDDGKRELKVREYPLLCISDDDVYDIRLTDKDPEVVYAQRIDHVSRDVKGSKVSYNIAMGICEKGGYKGYMHGKLPTVDQLKRMIGFETGPFKPTTTGPYWCRDGKLYNWETGAPATSGSTGYVRCVYTNK
ncbi:fimbrial protein [Parabacteroides pacaensis]|uniref:fimbrial protein n=1 Tax=Parabacteroides pacaensis TaxID=2086575 RepID=UPI000D0E8F41|nr:DUF4906 domain-containing protein [Parabacteroides pacaensis]